MEAKLVIVSGASKASEFKLKLPTVIGRSRSVDLPLGHSLVSRQHCELFEDNGVLKLRDLGSLNGTFMDGTRITAETVLEPGDQFTVGPVTFQAVYGVMPASTQDASLSSGEFSATLALPPRASSVVNGRPAAKQTPGAARVDAAKTDAVEQTVDPAAIDPAATHDPEAMQAPAAKSAGAGADPGGAPGELASNELPTEELEELELSEAPENFLEPAAAGFDAGQFNWLQDGSAGAAGGAEETIDFNNIDDEAPDGSEPAPRAPAGGKPDKKAPAKPAAKKPEAKKPDAKKPAKAAEPAAKSPTEPAAQQNSADEPDFMPPASSHTDPGVDDVFDFLQ